MTDYTKEPYWVLVLEFVDELRNADYWCKPDGRPNPEWVLFERDTLDAARDAGRDAAGTAAWIAAWDAAWTAAGDAARNAARSVAWTAARNAAWTTARDAAWDASLFSLMIVCTGLPMKNEHLRHVNARMEVWRKGYCLLCDVNGKLYVYAKKVKR